MPHPDEVIFCAILRVTGAPTWHSELTQILGEPTTCFDDERGSLWTLEPPKVSGAAAPELRWAGKLILDHEALFVRLLAAGVNVDVHLACNNLTGDCTLFRIEPELLAPFVRVGVPLEFYSSYYHPVP